MSDYYGTATLGNWLCEEVFKADELPKEAIDLFEKWREAVESNIEDWMETDDGDGNNLSWRGWGRGFNAIPDEDEGEFDLAIEEGRAIKASYQSQ